ncbi:MAG TPA: cytochrome C oxidase subunit IV family protein [Candidatus Sulfotelmatobacter sp.]|nr:cytochrome C oxidase subunit IV family protein [Candidatus Sulfotelmatobacter sp.]
MSQPTVSARTYTFTLLSLLGLTLLTSLLALLDLGQFSFVAGVAIAVLKASLIAGIFMHALYDTKLIRVVLAGGVIWFLIMISITLGDYLTRGWLPFPGK